MHTARVVHGSALALGALALSVPTASAEEAGLRISPERAAPGSTVTVSTTACGPDVTYGKGSTEAGGTFHLFEGANKGELAGTFEVPADARAGSDTITVKCPPRIKMTGTYAVTRHPSGAVAAGGGGTAQADTGRTALGGVLIAGAAAGGAMKLRRRMRAGGRS
ncbi:sortase [Kitasatospora camelliae]|uniref:Sortase n=1 Tax=Kitasatospora camelliae TaxID=3156397 RepID=A0AAU8JS06_9ACTN